MTAPGSESGALAGALPTRAGPRPRTTTTNPHMQLDQQPGSPLSAALVEAIHALPGVILAPSRRAPPGTVGFFLEPSRAVGPDDAFLLDTEFAHVHPLPDSSLHLTLPEPLRTQAINAGWAEPHPLAGRPTVSRNIVMAYAPRDPAELETVIALVTAAWLFASKA